jgi:hypothetical protein
MQSGPRDAGSLDAPAPARASKSPKVEQK